MDQGPEIKVERQRIEAVDRVLFSCQIFVYNIWLPECGEHGCMIYPKQVFPLHVCACVPSALANESNLIRKKAIKKKSVVKSVA